MQFYDFQAEKEEFPKYLTFQLLQEELVKLQKHFLHNYSFSENITNTYEPDNSHIFNNKTKINEYNPDIRKSKVIKTNKEIDFKILQNVVDLMNVELNKYDTHGKLIWNEIDIIKYEQGGYFNKHRDFVNFISDQMKTYALLICLEGTEEGGETIIHLDQQNYITINESKNAGGCLLFRNELVHEGNIVKQGNKIIIKLDIHCFKNYKLVNNYDDTLLVKFNFDHRYYVLYDFMYKQYQTSIFLLSQKFKQDGYIVLANFTFEEFKPVYEFLKGNNNNIKEIRKELDYLGIVNPTIQFIDKYEQNVIVKQNNKIDKLFEFINGSSGDNKLLLVKSFQEYSEYKHILKMDQDIIPIQFMLTFDEKYTNVNIKQLCIYDSIPIYTQDYSNEYWLDAHMNFNAQNDDVLNIKISKIRLLMNKILQSQYEYDEDIYENNWKNDGLDEQIDYDEESFDSESSGEIIIPDQVVEVKVLDVIWKIDKNRHLKPIIKIEPVLLNNAYIENVTGFNGRTIVNNIIGPGSIIKIGRNNSVIPHILQVLHSSTSGVPKLPDFPYLWTEDAVNIIVTDIQEDANNTISSFETANLESESGLEEHPYETHIKQGAPYDISGKLPGNYVKVEELPQIFFDSISDNDSEEHDNNAEKTDNLNNNIINKKSLDDKKLTHTDNDYEYLKELMMLLFHSIGKRFEAWYEESDYNLTNMENITIKNETCIDSMKLKKSIQFIKNNNIADLIKKLNHNKNVSHADYAIGNYSCNEAAYFMIHANIYFGFLNLK